MEATHDPTRCHELLRSMGALYEDLKSSYADCARLLERCIFLLPIVSEEAESSPIEFVELLQLMRDIRAYCGTFRQEYFYRTLVNVSSRHKHLTAIAGYIVRLIKAVTHLGLEKTINMEEWRRQDRDDAIESFKFCVNGLLDDYLDLGAQADDLIHDLMLHIDNNKTYVEELLSLAGYHPLKHSEKAAIDVRLAQLKEQVHRRHQYILARPPVPLDVQYQEDKKLRKAAREAVLQPHVLGVDQLTVTTESLGRGQLGEVYRGFYNNRMDVAIKVIPIKKSQTDAQFYKQIIALENEVVLLRHAEHPSILYCYGLARDPHHVYIVTELAEMGSLDVLIGNSDLSFPPEIRVAWLADLIDAISFLHSRHIHHGDIKAANLFVFRNFRLKLYHFGLSREQLSSARRRDAQAVRDLLELIKEDMVLFALCAASIIARKGVRAIHLEGALARVAEDLAPLDPAVTDVLVQTLRKCAGIHPDCKAENDIMSAPKAKEEIARAVVMAGGDIRDTTEVQRLEYEALEWTRAQRITAPPAAPSSAPPSSSTARKEDSVKEATLPTPHNEFEEFADSSVEEPSPEIAEILNTLNLNDACLTGDISALLRLSNMHALRFVRHVNQRFAFEPRGWTSPTSVCALSIACSCGHANVVELLLQHPFIEVNDTYNELLWTPLHFAADKGHGAVVLALLTDSLLDPNRLSRSEESPLYLATNWGHGDVVQMLLGDARTDVNIQRKGWSVLHCATDRGHIDIAELVLMHPNVEVNVANSMGDTPLHFAAYGGQLEILRLLLAHPKIDATCKNQDGETPLDILCNGYFVSQEHKDAMEALLREKLSATAPIAH